ncbi:MAG: hypothetical protein P8188_10265 [Gemmatimonadota bacterium]
MARGEDGSPNWARWVTLADPEEGLVWAREAAGGDFAPDSARLLQGFRLPDRPWLIREAPVPALAPPRVVVLRDTVVAGQRRVRLGILSRAGAEAVLITAPDGVSFQGVAGTPADAADLEALGPSVRTLVHWGRPEPDLTVSLAGAAGGPWRMEIVESLYRRAHTPGGDAFTRPPFLIPDVTIGSDRTVIRTPYTVGNDALSRAWPGGDAPIDPSTRPPVAPPDSTPGLAPERLSDTTRIPDSAAAADSGMAPDTIGVGGLAPGPDSTAPPDTTAPAVLDSVSDSVVPPDTTTAPDAGAIPDTIQVKEVGPPR